MNKIIAVDFDGTLCENKWPYIGEPNRDLMLYLKAEQINKHTIIILWTCRVGDKLNAAVDFCADHGLYFDYVNENCKEVIKASGAESRKIFASEYIDDRSSCKQYGLPFKAYDCSKCHLPECRKVLNKRSNKEDKK